MPLNNNLAPKFADQSSQSHHVALRLTKKMNHAFNGFGLFHDLESNGGSESPIDYIKSLINDSVMNQSYSKCVCICSCTI